MSVYRLTVYPNHPGSGPLLDAPVWGDVPHVGDFITIHPDGTPSDRSICDATITSVQRVLKGTVDPPGAPQRPGLDEKHVSVIARGRA